MSDAEHPSHTESCQHALDVFSVVVRHGSAGIEVMCQADEDISAFREAIAARTGVPSSRQKLVAAGRVLPLHGACRDILAPRAKVLLLATSGEAAGSAEAASIEVACEQARFRAPVGLADEGMELGDGVAAGSAVADVAWSVARLD